MGELLSRSQFEAAALNAVAAVTHIPAGNVVDRYGSALDTFLPCLPENERRLRCGVLFLRDRAMRAVNDATWEAGTALQAIASLASVHAYAPMTAEALETLHAALTRMMMAATALQMRGPRSEPHEPG